MNTRRPTINHAHYFVSRRDHPLLRYPEEHRSRRNDQNVCHQHLVLNPLPSLPLTICAVSRATLRGKKTPIHSIKALTSRRIRASSRQDVDGHSHTVYALYSRPQLMERNASANLPRAGEPNDPPQRSIHWKRRVPYYGDNGPALTDSRLRMDHWSGSCRATGVIDLVATDNNPLPRSHRQFYSTHAYELHCGRIPSGLLFSREYDDLPLVVSSPSALHQRLLAVPYAPNSRPTRINDANKPLTGAAYLQVLIDVHSATIIAYTVLLPPPTSNLAI